MRFLSSLLALVLATSACAPTSDSANSDATPVQNGTAPSSSAIAPTSTPGTGTTEPQAEPTGVPELGDPAWIGRQVELRLPPGGEGVEYGFDPGNMQTVVWVDGEPTGYWVWGFHGYFGADSYPVDESILVVGEGPDVHGAQWEEEANREFSLPPVEPVEPGTINDVAVWAVTRGSDLTDGSGASYMIWDVQPTRLVEDFGFGPGEAYYRNWDWDSDDPHPRLVGFADWQAWDESAAGDDPVPARLVFELVGEGDQLRLVVVDPAAAHFGWPDPADG